MINDPEKAPPPLGVEVDEKINTNEKNN